MQTSEKLQAFRNLWCIRTDEGGGKLSQCGHFAGKGVNFSHFMWTGPAWRFSSTDETYLELF